MVKITIDVPQDVLDEWKTELDKQGEAFHAALQRLMRGEPETEQGSSIKEWYIHNLLEAYQARNYIRGHHPNQYVRGRGPQPGAKQTGHVQTGESEGVAPGEIPPWELKQPAPARYEGDPGAVFSPAERHHRTGRYALGRRLQGTALSKDPSTEVSLHMFIPESATTFERKHFEDMIVSHSDHAQTHAGNVSYTTSEGGFTRVPGDNYYIRGNYKNIEELGNQIAPELRSTYGDNQHVKIMTNQTPSGIPIKSGKTVEHLRVVIPFKAGTPKNTVGDRVLSQNQVIALSKELSGSQHRLIVTHLDFNGMHLAISGEKEDMDKVASMLEKKGYHNKGDHEYGATRFVPTDVTYERYPITAVDATPEGKPTPKKVAEWLREAREYNPANYSLGHHPNQYVIGYGHQPTATHRGDVPKSVANPNVRSGAEGSPDIFPTQESDLTQLTRLVNANIASRLQDDSIFKEYAKRVYGSDDPAGCTKAAASLKSAWEQTSADHNPTSLAMQRVANEVFGAKGAQLQHLQFDDAANKDYKLNGSAYKEYCRAVYSNTQQFLQTHNIGALTLYRTVDGGSVAKIKSEATTHPTAKDVYNFDQTQQPLSAWTLSPDVAKDWANAPELKGHETALLSSIIPASRIYSTMATGPGLANLREVVVIGGETQTHAYILGGGGSDNATQSTTTTKSTPTETAKPTAKPTAPAAA